MTAGFFILCIWNASSCSQVYRSASPVSLQSWWAVSTTLIFALAAASLQCVQHCSVITRATSNAAFSGSFCSLAQVALCWIPFFRYNYARPETFACPGCPVLPLLGLTINGYMLSQCSSLSVVHCTFCLHSLLQYFPSFRFWRPLAGMAPAPWHHRSDPGRLRLSAVAGAESSRTGMRSSRFDVDSLASVLPRPLCLGLLNPAIYGL